MLFRFLCYQSLSVLSILFVLLQPSSSACAGAGGCSQQSCATEHGSCPAAARRSILVCNSAQGPTEVGPAVAWCFSLAQILPQKVLTLAATNDALAKLEPAITQYLPLAQNSSSGAIDFNNIYRSPLLKPFLVKSSLSIRASYTFGSSFLIRYISRAMIYTFGARRFQEGADFHINNVLIGWTEK